MSGCKFCGEVRPLVESHIIPSSFFETKLLRQKDPKKTLSLLSDSAKLRPAKRPKGIYDSNLFCNECENRFNKCDDYAFKLLVGNRDKRLTQEDENGQIVYQYYDAYDYDLLKLFFMSVLLRAGLCVDRFFQKVNLGPYVERLKKAFEAGTRIDPDDFAVFLGYYAQTNAGPIFFPSAHRRLDNVKFYYFHLGRTIFYIKVDKMPTPLSWSPLIGGRDVL